VVIDRKWHFVWKGICDRNGHSVRFLSTDRKNLHQLPNGLESH
jgi:hypothetical protein